MNWHEKNRPFERLKRFRQSFLWKKRLLLSDPNKVVLVYNGSSHQPKQSPQFLVDYYMEEMDWVGYKSRLAY